MRVLILQDDHWIADLLKQIVPSLRPHAETHWQLPMALREPIGACYALPHSVKRATVLMRQAAGEQPPSPDNTDQARLHRLAGRA
jgi:hypothetical protein